MDYIEHFHREAQSFLAAARQAVGSDAPPVPSCPGWTMTELVLHLGYVHRAIARVFSERLIAAPEFGDLSWLGLPAEQTGWLRELMAKRDEKRSADEAPERRPLEAAVVDWFGSGAAELERQFRATPANEPLWTWGASQTAVFWQRVQAIEAAIHRWDAENAIGDPAPMDAEQAVDAIVQTFEVMAPMRRGILHASHGHGERFRFSRTDGPGEWVVRFDDDRVTLGDADKDYDVAIAGTASDLMLFLWHRLPAQALDVQGDARLADLYFDLVPPL